MAGMMAAGAAAGTAIMPGWGTAIGAVAGGLADMFMDDGGGGGGGAMPMAKGPTNASNAVYGNGLDSSNFLVNFSGTQTATATSTKPITATGPTQTAADKGAAILPTASGTELGASLGLPGVPTWAFVAIGAALLWKRGK